MEGANVKLNQYRSLNPSKNANLPDIAQSSFMYDARPRDTKRTFCYVLLYRSYAKSIDQPYASRSS